jgi:hypothetical protein
MSLEQNDKMVIPLSKTKLTLLLFGSLAFVAGSIWIWSIADTQNRYDPLFMKGVALVGICFSGLCGLYWCIKIFDRKPGLVIDAEGIVDNSSLTAAGRIPWEDIVGFKIYWVAGQKLLAIEVRDPQKYVKRGGTFKRMWNTANTKRAGSPIIITSNALQIEFDRLVSILTQSLSRYRKTGQATH